ncbi:MAG: 16S rRNA (guanine(527)-N(7))-methyltransferase RsmG [Bergeyella sp.]|nr:16S rRNA (guanine(527)-N(7))-methyltransferase RsmG [Bergeyella sp.]
MSTNVGIIKRYFPELCARQTVQLELLESLYVSWNKKINVISRKDTGFLFERHILHSLGIAKVMRFLPQTKVLDVGTGGGFPGIPLAILFPEVEFTLIDSVGKKIKVVEEIVNTLQLTNVRSVHGRAESLGDKFHFVVSRAVTRMPEFLDWVKGKFFPENFNTQENGVLYLKGGDLENELSGIDCKIYMLKYFFTEDFFETKKVVYVPVKKIR